MYSDVLVVFRGGSSPRSAGDGCDDASRGRPCWLPERANNSRWLLLVCVAVILVLTSHLLTYYSLSSQFVEHSMAASSTAKLSDITPAGPITKLVLPGLSEPKFRQFERVVVPMNTSDGAGVRLKRSIGGPKVSELDPFLLLDEFKSDDPKDYEAGFPEHPHRGFETVTIMLHGNFKHQDSKGNTGYLTSGGVQWMTAGKGVQHSETPMQADGLMWGYQLWVNLPAAKKMQEPRYQDINADQIPTIQLESGNSFRLIAGKAGDVEGPVNGVAIQPTLLDVSMTPGNTFEYPIPDGHTLFFYMVEGKIETAEGLPVGPSNLVIFSHEGNAFKVNTPADSPARFLVISGSPIKEPIARHGPFVMNTREEIVQCFADLRGGRF